MVTRSKVIRCSASIYSVLVNDKDQEDSFKWQ